MKRFAQLYREIDASTATAHKLAAMVAYFRQAPPADAAWATYFLAGGKPRQVVPTALMRQLACDMAGIDDWLFEACYTTVGDLAETISYLVPDAAPGGDHGLAVDADKATGLGMGLAAPSLADPAALSVSESDLHPRGGAVGDSMDGSVDGLVDDAMADGEPQATGLAHWIEHRLLPLRGLPPAEQLARVRHHWQRLDADTRFIYVKLVGGGWRVGVSKLLLQRALAQAHGVDPQRLAQRMMGYTDKAAAPSAARYAALFQAEARPEDAGQPYPFFLAHPLAHPLAELPDALGPRSDWVAEWKYDGIRAQVVRRGGRVWVWSRGEELVTDRFPELCAHAASWPDGCVLDGEVLVWRPGAERPEPFALLQTRIGRTAVSRKTLAEAPVAFVAYDLLELDGQDIRHQPQHQRRSQLQHLAQAHGVRVSPALGGDDWAALAALRAQSRALGVEGLMLKHRLAAYGAGRTRSGGAHSGWWKWKIDPMAVDAVMVYAQAGHGRRANVYTDYTFAVWSRPPRDAAEAQHALDRGGPPGPDEPADALHLVPFAKAYSGLTDEEFRQVDQVVRKTTLEKFGPVRKLRPTLVFELGFEGLARSSRHKSGIATRFPRMLRVRHDKPVHEADSLPSLLALLAAQAPADAAHPAPPPPDA